MTLHHANAILWYLRTRLLVDLDMFNRPQVLVVKYEDISTDPARHFRRVFDFVGQPLRAEYLEQIHANSVRRDTFPQIPRLVNEACEALFSEIDRRYQETLTQLT